MQVPDQIVNEVMSLPAAARLELIAILRASLPAADAPGEAGSDELLAAEWTEELERRIAELRRSASGGLDPAAALALVRQKLRSGRGAGSA